MTRTNDYTAGKGLPEAGPLSQVGRAAVWEGLNSRCGTGQEAQPGASLLHRYLAQYSAKAASLSPTLSSEDEHWGV